MQQLLFIIHIVSAIAMVGLILMQHGKGADIGASFGSGASNTVFGSKGSVPFLMKITGLFALLFFASSLWLSNIAHSEISKSKTFDMSGISGVQQHGLSAKGGTKSK